MNKPLFGIVNINKPRFITSRAMVSAVHRVVKPAKAGHVGTLDPMATGVVLVCVGRATRLVTRLQQLPKTYRTRFVFGSTSDTDDATGTVTDTEDPVLPTTNDLEKLLPEFTGDIEQVPPAFSAVHVGGKRAYKLARKGQKVELKAKSVRVERFELLSMDGAEAEFEIQCGSGTYIRSLARDIGQRLGCGGLMSALERTQIGPFHSSDGLRVGGGEEPKHMLTPEEVQSAMVCPLLALPNMVQRVCTDEEENLIRRGHSIPAREVEGTCAEIALMHNSDFIAVGQLEEGTGDIRPRVVFHAIQ